MKHLELVDFPGEETIYDKSSNEITREFLNLVDYNFLLGYKYCKILYKNCVTVSYFACKILGSYIRTYDVAWLNGGGGRMD